MQNRDTLNLKNGRMEDLVTREPRVTKGQAPSLKHARQKCLSAELEEFLVDKRAINWTCMYIYDHLCFTTGLTKKITILDDYKILISYASI